MGSKYWLSIVAGIAVLVFLSYLSPRLAVNGMASAVEANDAARLGKYVDFTSVKENLKADLSAELEAQVQKDSQSDPSAAEMGSFVRKTLLDPLVDVYTRPESLAMLMKGDQPKVHWGGGPSDGRSDGEVERTTAYEGLNDFVVRVRRKGETVKPIVFHFRREGLFYWKLSAIKLPG